MNRNLAIVMCWLAWAALTLLPGQQVEHRRKAFRVAAPPWLMSETFEGTGTAAGWTDTNSPSWDDTSSPIAGSQSFSGSSTNQNSYYVFAGQTTVHVYGQLKHKGSRSSQTNTRILSLANSTPSSICALAHNYSSPNTQFKLYANGVYSSPSAAVWNENNTSITWHVWLTYVSGGTCILAMSQDGIKPSSDSSTTAYITATGSADTAVRLTLVASDPGSGWKWDNIILSTTPIGDNPTP